MMEKDENASGQVGGKKNEGMRLLEVSRKRKSKGRILKGRGEGRETQEG